MWDEWLDLFWSVQEVGFDAEHDTLMAMRNHPETFMGEGDGLVYDC